MARSNMGKCRTEDFMESFEDFELQMVIGVVLMSTRRFFIRRDQSHCLTFDPGLTII